MVKQNGVRMECSVSDDCINPGDNITYLFDITNETDEPRQVTYHVQLDNVDVSGGHTQIDLDPQEDITQEHVVQVEEEGEHLAGFKLHSVRDIASLCKSFNGSQSTMLNARRIDSDINCGKFDVKQDCQDNGGGGGGGNGDDGGNAVFLGLSAVAIGFSIVIILLSI